MERGSSYSFGATKFDQKDNTTFCLTPIGSLIPSTANSLNLGFPSSGQESPFVPIENLDPSIPSFPELGDIASVKHKKREYSPQGREQWMSKSYVDAWPCGGGVKHASSSIEGIYRHEQNLSVDTDCFSSMIFPEITAINSRLLSSSCPETKRIWNWTQRQQTFAQPCDLQRHCAPNFFNTTEFPARRRAVSDGIRPLPTDINPSTNSVCFLDVSEHRTYEQACGCDYPHQYHPQTSLDNGVFCPVDDVPWTVNYQSPVFVTDQASLHSPARDTEATSSLAPGVNAGFRAQVASEAVVEAAKRRRRHDEAKVFDCPMCSYQLTTKQNLQYHIAAHLGKRDHACGRCGKSFTTPHTRTRHELRCRTHVNPVGKPRG